jgi:hypothetical protein
MALWRIAQVGGILSTVTLLVGLVVRAEMALDILWNVLIPLVPASLLISPAIWRNVCPLATINLLVNRPAGGRVLTQQLAPTATVIGIALLGIMVPARRFLFNTDGVILAVTVAVVALLALVLGAFFDLKAGFCNAICPILPVERLYGQHPLVEVGNPRCNPCTMCTPKGCIDLAPTKSIAQTLGNTRRSHAWLLTGYGAFAAAFPGFVVGYYTTQDGPLATAGAVYGNVAVWALGSYLATAILVRLLDSSASRAMVVLAAAAAGLYYWYAASTITTAFAIEGMPTVVIRVAGLALVAVWFLRASPFAGSRNSISTTAHKVRWQS